MLLDAGERYREAVREFLSTLDGKSLLSSIIEIDVRARVTKDVREIAGDSRELTALLLSTMTRRYRAETIAQIDHLIEASISERSARIKLYEIATRNMLANSKKMFAICPLKLVNGLLQTDDNYQYAPMLNHQGIEVTRISEPYSAVKHYIATKGTVAVHARITKAKGTYRTVCIEVFNNTASSISVFCLSEIETLKTVNKLAYNKTSTLKVDPAFKKEYEIRVPTAKNSGYIDNILIKVYLF